MMSAQISLEEELIVDNFAGGGGASTGIELATGRTVDIAINHDPDAIRMHKTNHPYTEHLQASVWDVDPKAVCRGRPVGLAWFSPDCKHFSKAKGGKPVDKSIRGLAWIVLRWAGTVKPRVIILENVEEFQTWGPVRKGKPVKSKSGETFCQWLRQLANLGYHIQFKELVAADYGAPTTRKRFFLVARRDGERIRWPEPTHAPRDSREVKEGKKLPWRSAASIIDWSLPTPSIFDSREAIMEKHGLKAIRPLADNTMRRVIRGVDKFVIKSSEPFIIQCKFHNEPADINDPIRTVTAINDQLLCRPAMATWTVTNTTNSIGHPVSEPIDTARTGGGGGQTFLSANLIQYHDEGKSGYVRGQHITEPVMTIDASGRYGLAASTLVKYYGSDAHGQETQQPLHTVTAKDKMAVTSAHLIKLRRDELGSSMGEPVPTVTAGGKHHGMVTVKVERVVEGKDLQHWPKIRKLLNEHCGYTLAEDEVLLFLIGGVWHYIADIGLRMLSAKELYLANGFPEDYIIDRDHLGNRYPVSKQVARCGNAVPPPFATALVRANLPEWCGQEIVSMAQLRQMVAM